MKKINFLWSLAALPLLAACSSDDIVNSGSGKGDIPEGEGVYMTVNFTPFQGTRSFTNGDNSSDGETEYGTLAENNINRVLIVLATTDNEFIAKAEVETGKDLLASSDNTIYQAKAKFSKTEISELYTDVSDDNTDNIPVHVFIYCNPSNTFIAKFNSIDADWLNWTCDLADSSDESLWTNNSFPMTNESIATRYFPATFNGWNLFSTEHNPFDLSGMNNQNTSQEVNNGNTGAGGSINVRRMAARFDFRDGSQWMDGEGEDSKPIGNGIAGENFTYGVMKDEAGGVRVKAQIVNMSLVNVLKSEYYLGRVSSSKKVANWSTDYTLLGAEKPWFTNADGTGSLSGNYVVTPNASDRGTALTSGFGTYYLYPFFDSDGKVASRGSGWNTISMDAVMAKPTDENYGGNYHIWRYVTENTIAEGASDTDGQVNSSSTGVVFKTKLLAGNALTDSENYWDAQLATALNNTTSDGPILYYFSGNLYCSWEQIQYAALAAAGYVKGGGNTQSLDKSATLYKAVFGDGGTGKISFHMNDGTEETFTESVINEEGVVTEVAVDKTSPNYLHEQVPHIGSVPNTDSENWGKFRDAVVDATFTIYQKYGESGVWGYYNYYYYWNRHNDNNQNGVMAPMEFAVVRNNVYKLAVTSLNTLGHPRIPENDPDSPTPNTPDEKSDLYMTVSVQVLPWVVRINNIEF